MTSKKYDHKPHALSAKYLAELKAKKRGRLTLAHFVRVAERLNLPITDKNKADIQDMVRKAKGV